MSLYFHYQLVFHLFSSICLIKSPHISLDCAEEASGWAWRGYGRGAAGRWGQVSVRFAALTPAHTRRGGGGAGGIVIVLIQLVLELSLFDSWPTCKSRVS